ncbi:MAG: hypothetical protein HXK79_03390 [Lachnospiraceae bacterium]|nr:hypothetical protein [Lachnospiraceae bacterium]
MADAILMAGGTGGVSSDDVTAGKAQVLQGYTALTADSDDEPVQGTMVNRGNGMDTVDFADAYWDSKYIARMEQGFYAQVDQWKPYVAIPYAVLANGIHIDANKMLDTLQVAGIRGNIHTYGAWNAASEVVNATWENKVHVRFEEGYYPKDGNYKPAAIVPYDVLANAIGIDASKMLSALNVLGKQGQIKSINTQDNNYRVNKSTSFGIDNWTDRNNPVFYVDFPHGNGYYNRSDGHPHVCIDAVNLGTAGADSVLSGQTATSVQGVKFAGAIQRWICTTGDVITALGGEGFVWDDTHASRGRGIVTKILNNGFIQGANWVFLPSPNLQPWNIRQNVNVNGVVGTMVDYGAGGVPFNGATFDGKLASGVANKGFILRDIERYLNLKNNSYGYKGIVDGGLKLTNGYGYNTSFKSAPYVGFVLSKSINLTPFRQLKVGFRFLRFSGDGTQSQPAKISLEFGVTPISQAGGESYSNESYTILKNIGQYSNEISYEMTSTRVGAGNQSDQSQQYLTLDVSLKQGHHFIYFMLGKIIHEYSNGSVYAEVIINHIELIN